MNKNTDLIQGTLEMLILKPLGLEPMHGFGIARRWIRRALANARLLREEG